MDVKKILNWCFDRWLRPILFLLFAVALAVTGELIHNRYCSEIGATMLLLSFPILLASLIYQLIRKRWLQGVVTFLAIGGAVAAVVLYVLAVFIIGTIDGDKWADDLKIPSDIAIENPIDLINGDETRDSILMMPKSDMGFLLFNSFQPGLFEYSFWTGKINSGVVYIKAFEITGEEPLSAYRLPKTTEVAVLNQSDSIMVFRTTSHFTIYEGDWGKPYAARFEVWYKPDNGGKEMKLLAKNYKIEGWQR